MTNPNIKQLRELSREDILLDVVHLPQSSRLFVGSSDQQVYYLDMALEQPESQAMSGHTSYVTCLALAGRSLVSGSYDRQLIWWDVDSREPVHSITAHERWIRDVVSTPDGMTVASVADDMVCRLWDVEQASLRHELRGHAAKTPQHYVSMLYTCCISSDGQHLATGDRVGRIVVWELATARQLATLDAPTFYTWDPIQRRRSIGGIRALAFSPDGQQLAVGGAGQVKNVDGLTSARARVEVFDWRNGKRTHELEDSEVPGIVRQLVFHPTGEWLMAAGGGRSNGFLMFIDLNDSRIIKTEKVSTHLHAVVLNESFDRIFGVGHEKIFVWELGEQTVEPAVSS